MRRQSGFTLIEMLVVLTILGLIAGAVVTSGRPVSPSTAARIAANEIAGALRLARAEAMATNRPVAFTLDLAEHRYRVGAGPVHALPGYLALDLVTVRTQAASADVGRIRFEPDGSSSGGRVMVAGGARRAWIGVDWVSGRVSRLDR